ncbi:SIS domain-containing protein [archaeon]|nr:SIS domain-containing protein [archaeon]
MEELITRLIQESIEAKKGLAPYEIKKGAEILIGALKNKHKVLICGNGGSAAEAQHFSAELVGRFEKERTPLPAISLTTDTSNLTAIGNDYGFNQVFSRQVNALGNKDDVLVTLSTSGNSENIIEAVKTALLKEMIVINLLGRDGGKLLKLEKSGSFEKEKIHNMIIKAENTARIQEAHLLIIHIWCKLIENELFKPR